MKKTPKKELMTATMGMSSAEFGAALLTEARNRKQKQMLEKSVQEAQTVLASLDECIARIEYFTGWKQTREAQLAALQRGEFKLDGQGVVSYNDAALNRK